MTAARHLIAGVSGVAKAAPVFVAAATASGNGSLSFTIPNTAVVGRDVMYLGVETINTFTEPTPTGWTLIRSDNGVNGAGSTSTLTVFSRLVQTGDPGGTLAANPSAGRCAGALLVYNGGSATPDKQGATVSAANGTTLTAPSVTTTVPCVIVEFFCCQANGGGFATIPATSRADMEDEVIAKFAAAEQTQLAAGATGTHAATINAGGGTNPWVATTIAIPAV